MRRCTILTVEFKNMKSFIILSKYDWFREREKEKVSGREREKGKRMRKKVRESE